MEPRDRPDGLPDDIHESLVNALHSDYRALVVGKVAASVAALGVGLRTHDPVLLCMVVVLTLAGILRVLSVMSFRRQGGQAMRDRASRERWERLYELGGTLYILMIGGFCAATVLRSSDGTAETLALTMMMAYSVGIAGRNFASAGLVRAQCLAVSTPVILALLAAGDAWHIFISLLLVPFFIAQISISNRLRGILIDTVMGERAQKKVTGQLHVAMEAVGHGLALIGPGGTIQLANRSFAALAGLKPGLPVTDHRLDDLAAAADQSPAGARTVPARLHECIEVGATATFNTRLGDGRIVETRFTPLGRGGVAVLDDVTARVAAENEIRRLASFDTLTDLPNRRQFMQEAERLVDSGGRLAPCAVFFIDIDDFKDVNDTLGHAIGDRLLREIAERLRSVMPEEALICRFGGDEFVTLLPARISHGAAGAIAEHVIKAIARPIDIDGRMLRVGASVGIAHSPEDGADIQTLLKVTDAALYHAKAEGRGGHCHYSPQIGEDLRQRHELERDLREALERGDIRVFYQPLMDLASQRIITSEALARWQHPTRGVVSPAVFIAMAEERGLIDMLGRHVMDEATRACAGWPAGTRVAVNISSVQFRLGGVAGMVSEALARSGLAPERLEIEITETAMLHDRAAIAKELERIAAMGVRISLDDFGTGFSSLAYLHSLPLHKVKIDRSFLNDIESSARSLTLLSGVSELSHRLGLRVTVEGIERMEQLELLRSVAHVDEVQGFLFGRAMPARDIAELLRTQTRPSRARQGRETRRLGGTAPAM